VKFSGPIITKCQHPRKSSKFKSYICLFICSATRAVHLELVSNLSTEAFLAALRRFIARRGYSTKILSDNGTNFVGESNYLKTLFRLLKEPHIQDFASSKNIEWSFIPSFSPNFGGLLESSIKLAKRHLYKTCQGVILTFEELSTLLCQIEACINSRSLAPLSPDSADLRVLTPGHFLIGEPLLELPEIPTINHSFSLSSRWRILISIKMNFRKSGPGASFINCNQGLSGGLLALLPFSLVPWCTSSATTHHHCPGLLLELCILFLVLMEFLESPPWRPRRESSHEQSTDSCLYQFPQPSPRRMEIRMWTPLEGSTHKLFFNANV